MSKFQVPSSNGVGCGDGADIHTYTHTHTHTHTYSHEQNTEGQGSKCVSLAQPVLNWHYQSPYNG